MTASFTEQIVGILSTSAQWTYNSHCSLHSFLSNPVEEASLTFQDPETFLSSTYPSSWFLSMRREKQKHFLSYISLDPHPSYVTTHALSSPFQWLLKNSPSLPKPLQVTFPGPSMLLNPMYISSPHLTRSFNSIWQAHHSLSKKIYPSPYFFLLVKHSPLLPSMSLVMHFYSSLQDCSLLSS